MPAPDEALENLRVIRALMERATLYRAISAPTALVAGLGSVLLAGAMMLSVQRDPAFPSAAQFVWPWLGALALTLVANSFFLWRGARERGEPFISSGMRLVGRLLKPACLAGGAVTFWLGVSGGDYYVLAIFWSLFYGLGLLSTQEFAPKSIARLGFAFLWSAVLAGTAEFGQAFLGSYTVGPAASRFWLAQAWLAATFGGFHLIYAVATWPRKAGGQE